MRWLLVDIMTIKSSVYNQHQNRFLVIKEVHDIFNQVGFMGRTEMYEQRRLQLRRYYMK